MKNDIILPMVAYVLYIGLMACYMFITRLNAIRGRSVAMKYFKTYPAEQLPERVIVTGRHFDNQFQVPVLFLIGCAMHFSLGLVNSVTLVLAWGFVASRFAHAFIHLGSNHIPSRAVAYAVGWVLVTCLWVQLAVFAY